MKAFSDHFSRDSAAYARFRPTYPPALFDWLATLPAAGGTAWDCATGSGQAATLLAAHFGRVVASDASRSQVAAAERMPGVHYTVALGEASSLAAGSVDLVTVAQALHWLDRDRFYREVDRVLAPGGALAVWSYGIFRSSPEVDRVIRDFHDGTVGPFWPSERKHVEEGYRQFAIPIEEVPPPVLEIEASLTLPELLGYIRTWSSVGRYIAARQADPVEELVHTLSPAWGDAARPRRLVWPLAVRGGRWRHSPNPARS